MKKYLIASAVVNGYIFNEAYLFEVEFIDSKVDFYINVCDRIDFKKKYGKEYGYQQKVKFFKIKNFILRASDGKLNMTQEEYEKIFKLKTDENDYLKTPGEKVYFRRKISKTDRNTFLTDDIWFMPEKDFGLLFEAENDYEAEVFFRKKCKEDLYFGVLNEHAKGSLSNHNVDIIIGKTTGVKPEPFITKYSYWKYTDMKNSNNTLNQFIPINYAIHEDGIENDYDSKRRFLTAFHDFDLFKKFFDEEKKCFETEFKDDENFGKLVGYFLVDYIFYWSYVNCPVPIGRMEEAFATISVDYKNHPLLSNVDDFLKDTNYFIISDDDFYREITPNVLKFITDDIECYTIDGKKIDFKEYVKKKWEKR